MFLEWRFSSATAVGPSLAQTTGGLAGRAFPIERRHGSGRGRRHSSATATVARAAATPPPKRYDYTSTTSFLERGEVHTRSGTCSRYATSAIRSWSEARPIPERQVAERRRGGTVNRWLRSAEASSSPRGPSSTGRGSDSLPRPRGHPLSPHGGLTRTRKSSRSFMTSTRPSSGPEVEHLWFMYAPEQPETRTTRLGRNGRGTTPKDSYPARTNAPDPIGPRFPSGRPSSSVSDDFLARSAEDTAPVFRERH